MYRYSSLVSPVAVHDIDIMKKPAGRRRDEGYLASARGVAVFRNVRLDEHGDDKRCREVCVQL